jgi:hypothetical protein
MDGPAIIIAGSGMCHGGRIVNHLKLGLEKAENDVLFVGYQAAGTPGRDILKYSRYPNGYVIIDGEKLEINATIYQLSGYSAHADQADLVELIINRYQPLKIVQWGSLLDFQTFDENSDIDIAVEGIIDAEKYFALLGDAMLLTRFPLDIVQLERIESEFAELILSKGKLIYEHGK